VKIVREKYLSEIPGAEDRLELQRFLSQLYIFLVDQMHAGLKKVREWKHHRICLNPFLGRNYFCCEIFGGSKRVVASNEKNYPSLLLGLELFRFP